MNGNCDIGCRIRALSPLTRPLYGCSAKTRELPQRRHSDRVTNELIGFVGIHTFPRGDEAIQVLNTL